MSFSDVLGGIATGGLLPLFNAANGAVQTNGMGDIATQAQVNNAQNATLSNEAQQQAFVNALLAQNGIQNQSNVFNQMQGVANGTGPNPAQAMLNNSTGQNIANQTAAMGSQRGAGANPALIARQAAQQGGALQQNAAGQAAALQAQQQLGALNQMGGMANQQVNNLGNANSALTNALQNNQGMLQNARAGTQGLNANIGMQNTRNTAGLIGGVMNGAGAAMGAFPTGGGGTQTPQTGGMSNNFGGFGGNSSSNSQFGGLGGNSFAPTPGSLPGYARGGEISVSAPQSHVHAYFAKGGEAKKVPAMISPGEKVLSPKEAKEVAEQKKSVKQVGRKVPGEAKVKGDSLQNDTIPAKLEEGGFVIPRSIMESKDPAKHAAKFVQAHMTMQDYKKGK